MPSVKDLIYRAKGQHAETRFVKGRDGFWRIGDVVFNSDNQPVDWQSVSAGDNRIFLRKFASPEDVRGFAEFLLDVCKRPRVYEKGVTLVED